MFSRIQTIKSTESFSDNIKRLQDALRSADAVVIGAGAGLSAAAGFDYGGKRFRKYFADFEEKYGIHDMYSGGFYPYDSSEEYYALEDFQKKTNGSGSTQTFRTYLKKFIQKYGTYNSFTDSYKTELCSDGSFVRCCPTPTIFIADPDERKKKLFDYDCYIEVNKFWCGFEDIRDINNEKWPMLINAGDLNEYIGFHKLLVKSKGLGKQMIIMNR